MIPFPVWMKWGRHDDEIHCLVVTDLDDLAFALKCFERDALSDPDRPLIASLSVMEPDAPDFDEWDHTGEWNQRVGLSRDGAFLEYTFTSVSGYGDGDFITLGNRSADGEVVFVDRGLPLAIPIANLIPAGTVKSYLMFDLNGGQPLPKVSWGQKI